MFQEKRAPTNDVPSYKFCFEEGSYNQQFECHHFQLPSSKMWVCLVRQFLVMSSNVNFNVILILQLFAIALCEVSQPLNRKIT